MQANFSDTQCNADFISEACYLSKQKRTRIPLRTSVSTHAFDLVHCDVWGPFAKLTIQRHHYFLTIVDDYSRMTWLYLFTHKT